MLLFFGSPKKGNKDIPIPQIEIHDAYKPEGVLSSRKVIKEITIEKLERKLAQQTKNKEKVMRSIIRPLLRSWKRLGHVSPKRDDSFIEHPQGSGCQWRNRIGEGSLE
jgi:hypothetical protein